MMADINDALEHLKKEKRIIESIYAQISMNKQIILLIIAIVFLFY